MTGSCSPGERAPECIPPMRQHRQHPATATKQPFAARIWVSHHIPASFMSLAGHLAPGLAAALPHAPTCLQQCPRSLAAMS